MENIKKAAIEFKPYLKSVIWGGNKICSYKGIKQEEENIGESWEISDVPGHVSVVESGEYAGLSLDDLIGRFGTQLLGKKVMEKYHGKFPLLFKLIDANDNLSVQVHPDDALAMKRHNSLGKTEMWYIISTEKDAKIYAGLSKSITPDEYEAKVADGTFTDVIATHESNPGDVFFLPAGRVHAIGAGNLLAEIQESSDITYRIFDYNRRDANGNTRELHTQLAKDAIDYTVYDNYKTVISDDSQLTTENFQLKTSNLIACEYFTTDLISVDGRKAMTLSPDSFTVIMCLEGDMTLECEDGKTLVKAAHSVLLPAAVGKVVASSNAKFLSVQV